MCLFRQEFFRASKTLSILAGWSYFVHSSLGWEYSLIQRPATVAIATSIHAIQPA